MYLVEEWRYGTLKELEEKRNEFAGYDIEAVVERRTVGYGLDADNVLVVILKEKEDFGDWFGLEEQNTERG